MRGNGSGHPHGPSTGALQHGLHIGPPGSEPRRLSTPSKRQCILHTQHETSTPPCASPTTRQSQRSRTSTRVNPRCSPTRNGPESGTECLPAHSIRGATYDLARGDCEGLSPEASASLRLAPSRSRAPSPTSCSPESKKLRSEGDGGGAFRFPSSGSESDASSSVSGSAAVRRARLRASRSRSGSGLPRSVL